tara:strand:- start:99 stop:383 length:285 start_codon:yes stop_codon:yes gene_type:complete
MRISENKLRRVIRKVLLEAAQPGAVEAVIAKFEAQREQLGPMADRFQSGTRIQFEAYASGVYTPLEDLGPELAAQYEGWGPEDFQAVLDCGCLG